VCSSNWEFSYAHLHFVRKLSVQEEALETAAATREQFDNLTIEFQEAKLKQQQLAKENQALKEVVGTFMRFRTRKSVTYKGKLCFSDTKVSAKEDVQTLGSEMEQLKADHQSLKKELASKVARIEQVWAIISRPTTQLIIIVFGVAQLEQTSSQLDKMAADMEELQEALTRANDENAFLRQQIEAKDKLIDSKDKLLKQKFTSARELASPAGSSPITKTNVRVDMPMI